MSVSVLSQPPARGLTEARASLDEALLGLRAAADPRVGRRAAESEVAQALRHVYAAQAASTDVARFQQEVGLGQTAAGQALAVLQQQPSDDPGVVEATALVARAMRALDQARFVPGELGPALPREATGKDILRATVGEPRLLDFLRTALRPGAPPADGDAPEPPPPTLPALPATVTPLLPEALEALVKRAATAAAEGGVPAVGSSEPPPAAAPSAARSDADLHDRARTEPDVIADRARGFFEELATLGLMRQPGPGQSWTGRAVPERRLLARIDALVACGTDVLPRLVQLLEERPVPDPELTWAALMLLGSLAGGDACDEAVRLARAAPLERPPVIEAVCDALALAPHPGIEGALRGWLGAPVAEHRVVAARVLARRRSLTPAEIGAAARDPDARVAAAAAQALGGLEGETDAAPSSPLEALLHHDHEQVVRAALEAALLRRSDLAIGRARALVEAGAGERTGAALVLALGAPVTDALEPLRQVTTRPFGAPTARALGWFGHLGLVEPLIAALRAPGGQTGEDDGEAAGEATRSITDALQMLTGASLATNGAAGGAGAAGRPLQQAFAPPAEGLSVSRDPDVWAAWWRQHQSDADPAVRHRFGAPWEPATNLWQMSAPLATEADRRAAHLELVARTGGPLPFDPGDFVARQRRQLDAWRAWTESAGEANREVTGRWPSKLVRT